MRAVKHLNGSTRQIITTSKSALFSSLAYLALTMGAAVVPSTAFAALVGICPREQLGFPNGNICTSNDINFATALVADTQVGGCVPGQQVAVSLSANLELQGNNTRFDAAIYVSKDGSDIFLEPADGGPSQCEIMPIQGDWFATGSGDLAITDGPLSDGDLCSDSIGASAALVENVQLNYPGGPTFDDPVVIECIAGPTGQLEISAMIMWDNSPGAVCDGLSTANYPSDAPRCNVSTGEVPVDVLGRVTVIKQAVGGGATNFEFAYGVDNQPVNAAGINPTNPFFLQDGQSQEIYAELGTTGSAQIIVGEQNLPAGWVLSDISCTGDDTQPVNVNLAGGVVTVPLLYDTNDPANSQSDITCTFTNVEATTNLTLQKEWIDGAAGDTADLMTAGANNGMATSVATGAAGSEVDMTNTVVTLGTPGEVVTFSENLGFGNTGSYDTSFACTGNTNDPTYTPGATTATLLLDAADTDVTCTFTNTRATSSLTLRKEWVDGASGDDSLLDIDGVNDNFIVSTATGASGSEIDNTNTAVTVALSGETVTLSEVLGLINTGTYTTSFACSGNANAATYTPGTLTADLEIDAADTAIVCTYTNTRVSTNLTLQKEWVNGAMNDTADLTIAGADNDNNTSTASGAAGSEIDNVNTASTTVLSGETVTLSEMLGGGNSGTYDVTFACTNNNNAPTYTPGATTATLEIDAADSGIVCTYTNSRETTTLTLQKEWVDGVMNDTSLLDIAGIEADSNTSTATGAAGSEIDNVNTATTTIFSGETVFLTETLGGGNTGSYNVTFDCANNNNAPGYTPGDTFASLLIDPADTDVVCTYTNTRATSSLTLRKEWVNGVLNDTADLSTDGVNDGNSTSTSGGVAGSEVDNTNTVVTIALSGETVTLSEVLAGNTGMYDVSFACTDSANSPNYNPGTTTATLLIDGADTDIVCTYTNTLQSSNLTLRKQWIDGVTNDTADLTIDGVNDDNDTSTASGAAGSEIDDTNTANTTALAGETVTLSEMLGGGNTGSYTTTFSCTGNTNAPTYTPGATTATLLIDEADTDIVCTYGNTVQSAGLTLRKEWVNGVMDDTAMLSSAGNDSGMATSTASGAAGSEVDNVNTVITTTLAGETVTMSEVLGGAGNYTTSFACTGSFNAPTYTPGDTSATLLIDEGDTSIVCTFTNTLQASTLTLRKEWVDGAANDTAALNTDGVNDGMATSTATGAAGSEVDDTNTVVTTAIAGETVTLSEMLGGGNIGSYDVAFDCTGSANAPTYTPGTTTATLLIDPVDTDVVCTYTNQRQTSRMVLRKEWIDGANGDTSQLTASGANSDMDTSTASGTPGSEVDDVNTAIIVALSGETVTLSEVLGGGNTGSYDVSFVCAGNTNAPTYTPGDLSATLDIDAADSDITCTYTNTRQSANLTLRKTWVDGALDDTSDLNTDGVNDGSATSTATGATGSEIDNVNTVVTVALSGETVTLSEMLGGGNVGSYDASFACTGNTNASTYTPGDTSATLEIDAKDADIVCTYTNTRQTSSLTLRKEWVDGVMDDTADLNTDGVNDGNATSTATGAAGSEIDNTNTVVTIALSGETVTLSETLGGGNAGAYNTSFDCTGSTNVPTYVDGETTATLDIDGTDTDIVCTYTNAVVAAEIDLIKTVVPDSVTLEGDGTYTVQYVIEANNASDGPGEYDIIDNVAPGTGITLNTATIEYQVGVGEDDPSGTIVNTYPTMVTGEQLAGQQFERWTLTVNFTVDPATVDPGTADCEPGMPVTGTGFYNEVMGSDTDPDPGNNQDCDGLPDPDIDLIKTVDSGPTLEANGTYTVVYRIEADNLGEGPGFYNVEDMFTPGSGITLNTAMAAYQGGSEITRTGMLGNFPVSGTIVTGEALAGLRNEFWFVTANFNVDPVMVDPADSDCDPGDPVSGTGFYNEVMGVDNETDPGNNDACVGLPDPEIDLAKTVTNFDDSAPGTVTVTYEITATNLADGPGFYDVIDTIDPATGAVIVSAELVSYNAGSENNQSGMLAGALPYSFTSGELLVDDEALAAQSDESWTVVVEFDISAVTGEFECNGAGTGTYNSVSGSDTDPDPGNNADCGDLERERTTFVVTKDFSDDNPLGVTVVIDCNTGLPLMQQGVVHDPEAAGLQPGDFTQIEFIVNDFEPGTMDCDIDEIIPPGYEPTYTAGATTGVAADIFDDEFGCHYEDIEGGQFTCAIFNELQPVDVVVEKEWIDDNPQFFGGEFVEITLECDGPIIGGFPCDIEFRGNGSGNYCIDTFIDPDNPGVFEVLPYFEGTTCFATEEPIVGVLTDESDCEEMIVFPGQGDSCVIVNTRLYAGIPTLSQYGLLLLMLMMMGVGAVAFRRFV